MPSKDSQSQDKPKARKGAKPGPKPVPKPSVPGEQEIQERRFAIEYLRKFDATAAAETVGRPKGRAAREWGKAALKKPHVRALVLDGLTHMSARIGVTDDRTVRELARIGFANIHDLIQHTEDGSHLDLTKINEDIGAAVAGIDQTVVSRFDPEGNEVRTVTHKIKMADKMPALTALAKILCLFAEDRNKEKEVEGLQKLFAQLAGPGGSRIRPAK